MTLDNISKRYLAMLSDWRSNLPEDWRNLRHIGYLRDYYPYIDSVAIYANGGQVLDWGAGNGHISFMLRETGRYSRVISYLVTPSADTLDFLQNGLGLEVVHSDEKSLLPFEAGAFDCVVSSGVLEHVDEYGGDRSLSLKEIARILKPDGIFVAWRLPFAFSIWEYYRYARRQWYHEDRYTPSEVSTLVRNHGFIMERMVVDGVFFVAVRSFVRRFRIGNSLIINLERICNRFPALHFFLNDIYFVARKKS